MFLSHEVHVVAHWPGYIAASTGSADAPCSPTADFLSVMLKHNRRPNECPILLIRTESFVLRKVLVWRSPLHHLSDHSGDALSLAWSPTTRFRVFPKTVAWVMDRITRDRGLPQQERLTPDKKDGDSKGLLFCSKSSSGC